MWLEITAILTISVLGVVAAMGFAVIGVKLGLGEIHI